ncbi:MAG TPA: hypothetical protein DCK96_10620 [Chloroflexi bacterium]|nr:hypothetical protein [Chloroflexota bacterium]
MITSIVTFLSTRFVMVFVTTIVVVVAVPSLIIAINGNTVTITTGPVASASRHHDDERTQLIVKVKTAGDDVITKVDNEEASCDVQLAALAAKSKLSTADTQAAIAKGEGEVHAAAAPFVKEIKDDEAEIENLKVVTIKTEQTILVQINQVQVIALGENGTPGTIVTVCQTVIVEITQIIITITVQPPSSGEGDDLRR